MNNSLTDIVWNHPSTYKDEEALFYYKSINGDGSYYTDEYTFEKHDSRFYKMIGWIGVLSKKEYRMVNQLEDIIWNHPDTMPKNENILMFCISFDNYDNCDFEKAFLAIKKARDWSGYTVRVLGWLPIQLSKEPKIAPAPIEYHDWNWVLEQKGKDTWFKFANSVAESSLTWKNDGHNNWYIVSRAGTFYYLSHDKYTEKKWIEVKP